MREAWDNYVVLAPDGTRIEVKSSAYLQSWTQKRHSDLVFGRLSGLEWDASRNEYGAQRSVRADVFVFAVHTEREPDAYDVLDVSRWEFYVVGSDAVRAAQTRTVGIAWVRAQAGEPVGFEGLAQTIGQVASASPEVLDDSSSVRLTRGTVFPVRGNRRPVVQALGRRRAKASG